jgi:acyl-CoA reductase-like NAD-dependent aldehyde dehydrogenase
MALVEPLPTAEGGRRRLALRNPATLDPIGEIEVQAAADVRAAVERARKAQPAWAGLGFDQRARYLQRALRVLLERQDEFLEVIQRETGKPRVEVLSTELVMACDVLQFYAKRAKRILAERTIPVHLMRTKKLRISYKPLGVIGIITPWNYPFLLALNPTAQALMAGNAVVLKPSEVTPFSGRLLQDLFEAVGLPEGVFQVVLGDGETGAALVEAGCNKICFTGSVATGRKVGEACGRNLVPFTLELGGKDPMLVCADADLERAAAGAVYGAFANAGQVCVSTERVYVVDEVADAFVGKVVEKTAALRQGAEGEFDVGPMIFENQLRIVERQVEEARSRGARVLTGGRRNPACKGLFYEPTVLVDVTQDMAVMREETFGPVLPIVRVRDEEEALRLANETSYGLNANVWSRDKRKGLALAKRLESGSAVVNDCMLTYGVTESPFGGVKESGVGQVNGEVGLKSFCHAQSILVSRFGGKSEFQWFPYTRRKEKLLQRVMRAVWGSPLGRLLS